MYVFICDVIITLFYEFIILVIFNNFIVIIIIYIVF